MGKILFWVVIITSVALLTRILSLHNARQRHNKPIARKQRGQTQQPEEMVRCNHCSIYLPRSEAVLSKGKTWCSMEHAKLGPSASNQ